ncbi:MAG TPA: imidazole glycerol phosphate synthase subunit HisH [Bacillota bacterium]|nr:imidazole glycerol phosphate synthase subunit HisH [Bacillota bacterium]HNT04270.1 imidazole glycerol phosphate synthase subunit HisH [Bacillota bacterium]HOH89217.1 imidazole glycerol phosphate synthase subunit HisH [Bacillota bacterium]HPA54757.1 imidazole glycerol phosphate synthase subunit HisH [Bacillota bacterium]HPX69951.1 imidazole glycerol phosphate synthase subunit HisH [Bacillota bacterium]
MKLGIVDYGTGNIYSLQKALKHIGIDTVVSKDAIVLDCCSGIVLPGVGAFCDAAANMSAYGLEQVILNQTAKGKLVLGICLGMQLMYDYSMEGGMHKGLGLISGRVERIPDTAKVPHMGWNTLSIQKKSNVLEGIGDGDYVYYVHSYYVKPEDSTYVCACSSYGVDIPAVVVKENIVGMQFHPEKSGETGLKILNNLKELII